MIVEALPVSCEEFLAKKRDLQSFRYEKNLRLSELREETDVVFVKMSHVVDVVLSHDDSLDAHTESKAGIYIGVDVATTQNVGVYHARTEDFNPTLTFAKSATLAAAYKAGNVNLCGRLGKGEVVGTETYLCAVAEHSLCEKLKRTLEVAHGDALVNYKTLNLMEHGGVGSINRI